MSGFQRVYDKALNRKYSLPSDAVVDDGLDVLKEPAVNHLGDALPPEFDVTKSGAPAASAQKENS